MSKRTRIYFVRHGQVLNPGNRFYGRLPRVSLSDEGIKQIEKAANFLASKHIDIVVASPMLRTKQSARLISNQIHVEKITISRRVIEIGSFLEGKTFKFAKKLNFNHFDDRYRRPGDETFDIVIKRMTAFIDDIHRKFRGKNIVVVTHGDPMMILQAFIKNLPRKIEFIRSDKVDYVTYGEVWLVGGLPDKLSVKSVFKPTRK